MKQVFKIAMYSILLPLFVGCEKVEDSTANLTISNISFTETYRNVILDLPNGVYIIDNPNFDMNKAETWTGNMAKYVKHNYIYSVSYNINNNGSNVAYDTEIDLHYIYDNGEENVETINIGDIKPFKSISSSISLGCTNKQLIKCSAEVFWSD